MEAAPPRRRPSSRQPCAIPVGDFRTFDLGEDVRLHLRRTKGFATARLDLFVRHRLQRRRNTAVALISRLLERGTRRLPDLLSLNRFIDSLYGASFSAAAEPLGPWQVLHLYIDVVEGRFTPDGSNSLPAAFAFLGEVLHEPAREGDGFPEASVRQEKAALAQVIAAHASDRTVWALRRCTEEMCRGRACALPAFGDRRDLPGLAARDLLELHFEALTRHPTDIYICSSAAEDELLDLTWRHLVGQRSPRREPPPRARARPRPAASRVVVERQEVQQGRLVLGYRTDIHLNHPDFPGMALLDMVLGGDVHSRLYRVIREERGLAYHVGSSYQPLCGLFHVEAGIDPSDLAEVRSRAREELEDLGERGPTAEEIERSRRVAAARLASLTDDREGLTRFAYYRVLGECDPTRRALLGRLERTGPEDVARAARGLCLDTTYFMTPGPAGSIE